MQIQNLDPNSRVWIYIANKSLDYSQVEQVKNSLELFLKNWSAHGAALFAGFEIQAERIVIVAVDETKATASGCSIDKLVHLFQDLGKKLNVDFFDRMQVAYEIDNQTHFTPLNNFWAMRKANLISDETLVYDTTVRNLQDWKLGWKKKFGNSWHAEVWGR
jgi:hypothetical protein